MTLLKLIVILITRHLFTRHTYQQDWKEIEIEDLRKFFFHKNKIIKKNKEKNLSIIANFMVYCDG